MQKTVALGYIWYGSVSTCTTTCSIHTAMRVVNDGRREVHHVKWTSKKARRAKWKTKGMLVTTVSFCLVKKTQMHAAPSVWDNILGELVGHFSWFQTGESSREFHTSTRTFHC